MWRENTKAQIMESQKLVILIWFKEQGIVAKFESISKEGDNKYFQEQKNKE